jgi:diaminopimelate epimerase
MRPESIQSWVSSLCTRSFGVGADGLIVLDSRTKTQTSHYRWHFYNADGSRAEMCGNGSRCAGKLAYTLGLAPADHTLETEAGQVHIQVNPNTEEVKVALTTPRDLQTHIDLYLANKDILQIHYVNTGVPHAIVLTEDPNQFDLTHIAPEIRFHSKFAPQGTNVNIVHIETPSRLSVRTYERGVEDETFACGTGAAASAFITYSLGLTAAQTQVITSGGEHLSISLEQDIIYLEGKATLIYEGILYLNVLGLDLD